MATAKKTATEPQHPAAAFVADQGADGVISAEQLADLVQRDGKTVRARLRRLAARDQSLLKGARWKITETLAVQEFDHYAALDAEPEAEAEAVAESA